MMIMEETPMTRTGKHQQESDAHRGHGGWRGVLHLSGVLAVGSLAWSAPARQELSEAQRRQVLQRFGGLPLNFVENQGQSDPAVAYYLDRPGFQAYFAATGIALRLTDGQGETAWAYGLQIELVGASATTAIQSVERGSAVVSYFKGPCEQWKTGIPTATEIAYRQPWPGVDLHYRGREGKLEAVYVVAPGADPAVIRLRYAGQEALKLDEAGKLVLETPLGDVAFSAPILYQEIAGRRVPVDGRFIFVGADTVAFQVAAYDKRHPLIIDPTLAYAGYVGGLFPDSAQAVAVDSAGAAYLVGYTVSAEATFPVALGPDLTYNGGTYDAFVAKVNTSGSALVYAGYVGGSDLDRGFGIAADSTGAAYVTGITGSSEATFPVTVGPDLTKNGGFDAFVAKVNPSGTALVYAGYVGGSSLDEGLAIAVDSAGAAYVAGYTGSSEATFPVTVGPDLTKNVGNDAFVAKINPSGTALAYAGYVGGSGSDYGSGIAVDSAGAAYLGGYTDSTEATFPVTVGPDLTFNGGAFDAFVAKVNPVGTALAYAGYVGGSGDDEGFGTAVDSAGEAFLTGRTDSTEATFPATVGPDLTLNGSADAFVAKVNASGTALVYAGYVGGSGAEYGAGIAVDSAGSAYVAGSTNSTEVTFPVIDGPDLTFNGSNDAFVAKVDASGTALSYAGYVGGSNNDAGIGIAVDGAGAAYLVGFTLSTQVTFPVTVGPDLTYNGSIDAFVAKVTGSGAGPTISKVKSKTSKPGSSARIGGSGFSADAKKDLVYFGTKKAKIKKAKSTLLKVIIPSKSKKGVVDVYVVANGVPSNKVKFTIK